MSREPRVAGVAAASRHLMLVFALASLVALLVAGSALATDVGGTGGPGTGHEHPVGASPMRVSLVPAFNRCTPATSNAAHDPALPGRSCSPPVPSSSMVAVGPNSLGFSRFRVLALGECAPFDSTHCFPDVVITGNSSDVRAGSPTGPLFSGSLTGVATIPGQAREAALQVTDAKNQLDVPSGACTNTPNCSATVVPLPFPVPISCSSGTCSVATTANTLAPGSVTSGRRGIVETGQLQILDTQSKVFAVQGVFAP